MVGRVLSAVFLICFLNLNLLSELCVFRFFTIARASSAEVGACIDLMRAFRLLTPVEAAALKSRLEAISKMLWGLMR
ncbi:MAG: four helix bundle protein [Proteobacteria bacterium]|nr:four helix bundle protein [Pseudomonadota bacterium]